MIAAHMATGGKEAQALSRTGLTLSTSSVQPLEPPWTRALTEPTEVMPTSVGGNPWEEGYVGHNSTLLEKT